MSTATIDSQAYQQFYRWWRKYGLLSSSILIIAILALVAWLYWQNQQEKQLLNASEHYQQLLTQLESVDDSKVKEQADQLIKQYPNTPYAKLAALFLAHQAIKTGDLNAAAQQLQWALAHAKTQTLRQIARIRLARVLLAQHQPQQAIDLLKKVDDASYLGIIEAVKGDSYLSLGQTAKARDAYTLALQNLPAQQDMRPFIQMKLDNLPILATLKGTQ